MKESFGRGAEDALFHVDEVYDEELTVTRMEFEDIIRPTISKITETIDRLLQKLPFPVTDISSVKMVGGSCRILLVQEMIYKFFATRSTRTTVYMAKDP